MSGCGWQPPGQSERRPPGLPETGEACLAEVELPGAGKDDDISAGLVGRELVTVGEFSAAGTESRSLRRGRRPGRFKYRVLLPGRAEAGDVTAALAGRGARR